MNTTMREEMHRTARCPAQSLTAFHERLRLRLRLRRGVRGPVYHVKIEVGQGEGRGEGVRSVLSSAYYQTRAPDDNVTGCCFFSYKEEGLVNGGNVIHLMSIVLALSCSFWLSLFVLLSPANNSSLVFNLSFFPP